MTVDGPEAKGVYDWLKERIRDKVNCLELTHKGKSFVINVDKIRLMEYTKGE